jgi:hypothetical protein
MPSQMIFRSQLNELIQTVIGEDFAPGSIKFDRDISKTDLQIQLPITIRYKDSDYYFKISFHTSAYYISEYFPGLEPKKESRIFDSWSKAVGWAKTWMDIIKRELSQPNPWILLNQGNMVTDTIPDDNKVPEKLNEEDFRKIHEYIRAIKEFVVSEIKPSPDQIKEIDDRLNYLEESAKRQNKRDWAHTAIGVTFTIAIGLALAPEQASKLFSLTSEFLKTIFMKLLTS